MGYVIPAFARVSGWRNAALLMPYLGWLVYATRLNVAICGLNPTRKGYSDAALAADVAALRERAGKMIGV